MPLSPFVAIHLTFECICRFYGAFVFILNVTMFNTHQSNSHTLLQQLRWLPNEYRINFEIASITFSTLYYLQLVYL